VGSVLPGWRMEKEKLVQVWRNQWEVTVGEEGVTPLKDVSTIQE